MRSFVALFIKEFELYVIQCVNANANVWWLEFIYQNYIKWINFPCNYTSANEKFR